MPLPLLEKKSINQGKYLPFVYCVDTTRGTIPATSNTFSSQTLVSSWSHLQDSHGLACKL